jgi:hypothetical protein
LRDDIIKFTAGPVHKTFEDAQGYMKDLGESESQVGIFTDRYIKLSA